jgi:hypothetical protein
MEKYDGLRVFWDRKALYYNKKRISVPTDKISLFPDIPFEGELW